MEPTTDLPHLNYIFSMQEAEQKEYLKAVGQELTAHPIHHLSAEWGCFGAMDPNRTPDELARGLLSRMTLAEKVNQMSADIPPKYYKVLFPRYNCKPYYAGEDQRLEIPALKFTDGPTGIVSGYASTAFPVSMARGASFDPKLEERIGDAIGVEGRSAGANLFGGVCINLLRHPAWGRAQETYGEDPFLVGQMGAALVRGVQRHMMACVKHFAANSMENARFRVDVQMDERALQEVYLPHFHACVKAGAAAVMSAYNRFRGEWCSQNRHLLREILKEEWGFQGFVLSDFIWGVRETDGPVLAGLDLEMPVTQYFGPLLIRAVESGHIPEAAVEESAFRILRQKIRFSRVGEPNRYGPEKICCTAHRELSREAEEKSAVLLKNRGILPLRQEKLRRLAVIGALAATPNIGDMKGSSAVFPPYVVTPLEGLQRRCGDKTQILYASGEIPDEVTEKCRAADAAVVFAGLTCREEGEYIVKEGAVGGDRPSLALDPRQRRMIEAARLGNCPVIVCLMGGSAILTADWEKWADAILYIWYPGMEGGTAVARLLLGDVSPSGKLPFTLPETPQQLPYFDRSANRITYDLFHGYFLADRMCSPVTYPFGFGLSYTTFSLSDVRVEISGGILRAQVSVANTGACPGGEVVQLYVACMGSAVERHPKDLRAFQKIYLDPGESRRVLLTVPSSELRYYDAAKGKWQLEDILYCAEIGTSSRESDLVKIPFRF